MNELVEKYIKLRDVKAQLTKKHKDQLASIEEILKKIEAELLLQMQASGAESVRTAGGTAYRSTRTSATVADWEAFLNYVRANEAWEMLERRASKDAVVAFREENNDLPPGLNWREELVVNVRRS